MSDVDTVIREQLARIVDLAPPVEADEAIRRAGELRGSLRRPTAATPRVTGQPRHRVRTPAGKVGFALRIAALAALVVAGIVVATVVRSNRPHSAPQPVRPGLSHLEVLLDTGSPVALDAATGARVGLPRLPGGTGNYVFYGAGTTVIAAPQWTASQTDVLAARDYTERRPVFAFRLGSTHVTDLGTATFVYRGPSAGTTWLYTRRGAPGTPPASCDVRLLSGSGATLVPPASLPCAWQVFGPVDQGLAVFEQGSAVWRFAVWTPPDWASSSFRWPAVLPSTLGTTSYPEAAGSTIVLATTAPPYQAGAGWPITVDDTATGASRTVTLPSAPGSELDPQSGELSPDGRLLAYVTIPATSMRALEGAPEAVPAQLVVVRISTGSVVNSRRITVEVGGDGVESLALRWSPDSAYVVAPSSRSTLSAVPVDRSEPVRTIAIPEVGDAEGFVPGLVTLLTGG